MDRQVPESGKIYAFNEGNYMGWEKGLQDYMMSLKDPEKHGGKPYSARSVTYAVTYAVTTCIKQHAAPYDGHQKFGKFVWG